MARFRRLKKWAEARTRDGGIEMWGAIIFSAQIFRNWNLDRIEDTIVSVAGMLLFLVTGAFKVWHNDRRESRIAELEQQVQLMQHKFESRG